MQKQQEVIHLHNTTWYRCSENQRTIWLAVRRYAEEKQLSRDGLLNDMSLSFTKEGLTVFMPLLGDIAGRQHYVIPEITMMGSGRWLSTYLLADNNGMQVHAPTRLTERVRLLHLYLLIKKQTI